MKSTQLQTCTTIEIVAIDGRLEFGFWGWIWSGIQHIWAWLSHCSITVSSSISGTCKL